MKKNKIHRGDHAPVNEMTVKRASFASIFHLGPLRLTLFIVLFVLLSAAVPYAIYLEMGARPLSLDDRWLSWPFLSACVALLTLYFSTDGLRLYYTLKALGCRIPLREIGPLVFINILVSNITPMATGGGFAQIWYLRRQGVHIGAATAATTLRTLQAVALIFLPTPFLLLFMPSLQNNPLMDRVAMYLAFFAVVYLVFFAIVLLRMHWIMALVDAVLRRLDRYGVVEHVRLRRWRFGVRRELIRFSHAFRAFFKGPRSDRLLAMFFTALFLLILFSFPALLLWGLDYRVDYFTSVGLLVVTTFIMYFSPTPGAAGIAEGVFGLFFASLVDAGDLLLAIVAWRFLTIHLGMLLGVPVTLRAVFAKRRRNA